MMGSYRMIHVDHYLTAPQQPFDDYQSPLTGQTVRKVPIIRIFGTSTEGRKACIHVHGYYPYMYILNEPNLEDNLKRTYGSQIFKIETVKAFNYYGYHKNEDEFLKLYLYDPRWVKKFSQIFEPNKLFWAHLPYVLLFFMDNNLRGMSMIELSQIYWRKDRSPNNDNMIDQDCDTSPSSTCELEGDTIYEYIVNRQNVGTNDTALRELWLDDQNVTIAPSIREIEDIMPLHDLEKDYIRQLCYSLGIDSVVPESAGPEAAATNDFDDDTWNAHVSTSNCDPDDDCSELNFFDDDDFILNAIKSEEKPAVTQSSSVSRQSTASEHVNHEYQFLTVLSLELHVTTRNDLRPDPNFDSIEAAFYCVRNDVPDDYSRLPKQVVGLLIVDPFQKFELSASLLASPSSISLMQNIRALLHQTGLSLDNIEINIVNDEFELIIALVNIVKTHDPELMIGYDIEKLSWGYLLERSKVLNISISCALSRIIDDDLAKNSEEVDTTYVQPITFSGRLVFSTWMMVRHEHNLCTTSYENIHHHALNERVPCFSFKTLTKWFSQNKNRWRVIDYYLTRVVKQMQILDKFDLITKISELARCYGTQFVDVITRGSQIGIESMMLRIAILDKLCPLSPPVALRNKMRAPESLPLVMEPESNIYYDPVAVLDFQSLYPSVVIAYNYCYSSCLGRVMDIEKNKTFQFGCSDLNVDQEEIKRLLKTKSIHVSPCGVAFVKKNIKHGVLPRMLSELITTRAMVKDQMKENMKSKHPNMRLQRILDHRQHGLKMMANTTYGYTGASYTGRMPCIEIADSIVSKGREILENAMSLVESNKDWGAKVVYGDTDSIFIKFAGCDRETAFKRAYEMVDAITASNPHPIRMKFEKIYQPCVLQTKKRYCGFKYEYSEQKKPEFEAKGIETVRRDSCPIAVKILEMALRIQFTSRNIDEVKSYVQRQFIRIMSGKLSNTRDFVFSRQYKPRDIDKEESVFVPAWQIARRLMTKDPRAEPTFKQRIPFIITYGQTGTPLVHLARTPIELLQDLSLRVNSDYYIQKIICPTLNRVFHMIDVDTLQWFKEMPKQTVVHRSHFLSAQRQFIEQGGMAQTRKQQATISQFFGPAACLICAKPIMADKNTKQHVCEECKSSPQSSVIRIQEKISTDQRKFFAFHQICKACSSLERAPLNADYLDFESWNPCISYDCDNLFQYHQARLDALDSNFLAQALRKLKL